jgi:hypothetical protein
MLWRARYFNKPLSLSFVKRYLKWSSETDTILKPSFSRKTQWSAIEMKQAL